MKRLFKLKKIVVTLLMTALIAQSSGCVGIKVPEKYKEKQEEEEKSKNREVEKASPTDYKLKDNSYIYEGDDDGVVTMYLTVSRGNASDNTDHSWEEVNKYNAFYYSENDLEKYGVNGLLQVGDELGPASGELGYGRTTPNCTVVIRGQTSSKDPQKGYKIKINKNQGDWRDQTVINLNKHEMEGLRFRNKMMFDLQKDLPDMTSLRTQFVHLYVKDLTKEEPDTVFYDYGLYTQVEQPNKKMLKAHGLDPNGNLYKENQMFEFFYYDDIRLVTDPDYDEKKFNYYLKTRGSNDHSKLIEMLKDVNDGAADGDEILDKWFDRENLSTWMAFNIITGNVDTQSRNTLLYSPSNLNTWFLMDWDCDAALRRYENSLKANDPAFYKDDAWGWEIGVSNYWSNVLFQKILKSESFRKLLDEKVEAIYKEYSSGKVMDMAKKYAAIVKPYCYGPVDKIYEPLKEEEYDKVLNNLNDEMKLNYELYKKSLDMPMPFYIGKPVAEADKTIFTWDTAYSFRGSDIRYSIEIADNYDFNKPIIKEDNLFIGQYDYAGNLKAGQYFIRVKAYDDHDNSQTAFDYYVTEDRRIYGTICFYVEKDGTIKQEGE